jgi:hypothetical protein
LLIIILLAPSGFVYSEESKWDKEFIPILSIKFDSDIKAKDVSNVLEQIQEIVHERLNINLVYEIREMHYKTAFKNENVDIKPGQTVETLLFKIATLINCRIIYDKADKVITFEDKH